MIDHISQYFQDPLIQKGIWSGIFFIVIFILILLSRRLAIGFKPTREKIHGIRRWINGIGVLLLGIVLFRIWAYPGILGYIPLKSIHKILISGLLLFVFYMLVYFLKRLIGNMKMDENKRRIYQKGAAYLFGFLFVLIMIRVWAVSDLFVYFKSSVMNKMFKSGIALAFVYSGLFFMRRFINSLKVEIAKRHEYRKRASYIATLVYIIILIPIWAGNTQQWATVLSVMGAGVALALHEVLLNIAGWFYILIRRPYKAGDRIELGSVRGDVIDIQVLQTSLLEIGNWVKGDQSTGRLIHLPHGKIFRDPLFNYTKGFEFIWNEISVLVTFESNWEKAKEIFLKFGEEESQEIQEQVQKKITRMSREYLIYYRTFTPIVYTHIEDSGVLLTLRYLTDAKKRRAGENTISQKMLKAIYAARDINFAYPTYRVTGVGEKKKN